MVKTGLARLLTSFVERVCFMKKFVIPEDLEPRTDDIQLRFGRNRMRLKS